MKIQNLEISIRPTRRLHPAYDGFRIFKVRVEADGQVFESQHTMHESDFKDMFGYLMQNAERRIRDMVADKTNP